ncbi:MAG TPA: GTPase [Methanomassiliicoccales archaeon]|nr:GTPase [Methanomassiliicoccales archaeon]
MVDWRRKIPTILKSNELLDKALHKASKISQRGNTRLDTAKKTSLAKVSAVGDVLNSTLMKYVRAFPNLDRKEEFYSELVDVLVGVDPLKKSLGAVSWCAKKCSGLQREYLRKIRYSKDIDVVDHMRKEFYGRISSVVDQISKELEFLGDSRNKLRKLPNIDTHIPTAVIAGFPNVGKSQLIEKLSNARPVIATYPFTTKGVGVGHFTSRWQTYQLVDTPGLLDRPLEERNAIERQAVLAIKYLADLIVFMIDPTETSGYTIDVQLHLLHSLKEWMPEIPIIEVENKADIERSTSSRIKISALEGEGVEELRAAIMEVLAASPKLPSEV